MHEKSVMCSFENVFLSAVKIFPMLLMNGIEKIKFIKFIAHVKQKIKVTGVFTTQ